MNPNESLFYKRRLPHLYITSHPVFITWRLKFDLPISMKLYLKEMKDEFDKKTKDLSEEYKTMQGYTFHKKVFGWMDTQFGIHDNLPSTLYDIDVRKIVSDLLHLYNENKYQLHAYCIMPNHVHVLFTPYTNQIEYSKTLSDITYHWKRIAAININKLLNKTGALWASESYDHAVRNETEFSRIIMYILNNPVKANLTKHWHEWQGSWVAEEYKSIMR